MSRASDVHETGMTASDSEAHMTGSEILVGLGDELVAVWDGKLAWGYGGTADVVAYAERNGVPVRVLWPEAPHADRHPARLGTVGPEWRLTRALPGTARTSSGASPRPVSPARGSPRVPPTPPRPPR